MDTTPLSIDPGQALTLPPGPAGRRLRVLQGRLWLTASGCPDDEVVAAGAERALPAAARGALVVEALDGPARAELLPARASFSRAARTPGAAPGSRRAPPVPAR